MVGTKVQRLLLVDDEPLVQRGLALLVRQLCEVATVGDAEQALEMLAAQQFDAVLTDFYMPGESGLWLLEQIRTGYPRLRRALMSGQSIPELDRLLQDGLCEVFLEKPIDSAELNAWLRSWLV